MKKRILIEIYKNMQRIRKVESMIADRYKDGKMRCPVHLSIGQELVPAICSILMKKHDYAVSSHRCHAHYISKGGDVNSMIAEIYGKKSGCSRGKGGSMHLIDLNVNFMGSSAIVGNSIPTGVGLALAAKLEKKDRLSFIFFGEGATEEGVFYESLNFAALKKLPAIFVCENNLYSVYSPLEVRQAKGRNLKKMVHELGLKSESCDTQKISEYYNILNRSIISAREGQGPVFIELSTYRWREHCGPNFDNDLGYRSIDEFNYWKSKDPLENLEKNLNKSDVTTIDSLEKYNEKLNIEIETAFTLAESDSFPEKEDAFKDVYAERFYE